MIVFHSQLLNLPPANSKKPEFWALHLTEWNEFDFLFYKYNKIIYFCNFWLLAEKFRNCLKKYFA